MMSMPDGTAVVHQVLRVVSLASWPLYSGCCTLSATLLCVGVLTLSCQRKTRIPCAAVRRYLGGERNVEGVTISDNFDLDSRIGKNKTRSRSPQDREKIAIQNRQFDDDLQHPS